MLSRASRTASTTVRPQSARRSAAEHRRPHSRNEDEARIDDPGLVVVGDTGIEPVTSSVSGKRATAAPIAQVENGSSQLGGGYGIRTRVYGFAGRCLASRPIHRVWVHHQKSRNRACARS